ASGNFRGRGVVGRGIVEIELEGIAFAKIRRISTIFKTVIENAKSAAYHQLWTGLVSKAHARGKIELLGSPKSAAVLVRDLQVDAVLRQQSEVTCRENDVFGLPGGIISVASPPGAAGTK